MRRSSRSACEARHGAPTLSIITGEVRTGKLKALPAWLIQCLCENATKPELRNGRLSKGRRYSLALAGDAGQEIPVETNVVLTIMLTWL